MNYALLVGVGQYHAPKVNDLKGPPNDVGLIRDYLEHIHPEAWQIHEYSDRKDIARGEGTRANIIAGFRGHLQQAQAGEMALFYFSGHGALERSPDSFVPHQQDAYHEALVPADYQLGGYFLADKEIGLLISEVQTSGAEVVVIFDCCHAGSGTRFKSEETFTPRQLPKVKRPRPLDSFLEGVQAVSPAPAPAYFLAASAPRELSIEKPLGHKDPRPTYGVFTRSLIDVLTHAQKRGGISYYDLMGAVRLRVAWYLHNGHPQTPQLEITGSLSSQAHFLNHSIQSHQATHVVLWDDRENAWVVNLGVIHGLSGPARLQIIQTRGEELRTLGEAAIRQPDVFQSPLELDFPDYMLIQGQVYQAIELDAPRQPLAVWDPEALLQPQHFPSAGDVNPEQLRIGIFTREMLTNQLLSSPEPQGTAYEIHADEKGYHIHHTENHQPLDGSPWPSATPNNPQDLARLLLRLAKWERLRLLGRDDTLPVHLPQLLLSLKGQETGQADVTLDWEPRTDPANMAIQIQSRLATAYYVQGIYLSRHVQIMTLNADVLKVGENGAAKLLFEGELGISPNLDQSYPAQVFDHFLVLFSQRALPHLGLDEHTPLSRELGHRDLDFDEPTRRLPDLPTWFPRHLRIKTLLTQGHIGAHPLVLPAYGLHIAAHPSFRAQLGFSSSAAHMQAPLTDRYLRLLAEAHGLSVLEWGSQDLLTQIEIHHIQHPETLTETPLELTMTRPQEAEYRLWAVTLPEVIPEVPGPLPVLGEWEALGADRYRLRLHTIPPNPDDGRLEPGRSLKIVTLRVPRTKRQPNQFFHWALPVTP